MKRLSYLLITSVLFFVMLFCVPVHAHSGRTDEFGGHYDHSTGEYHYHHGYEAHQHNDGKCPYDENKNCNESPSNTPQNNASDKASVSKKLPAYRPLETSTIVPVDTNASWPSSPRDSAEIVIALILLCLVLIYIVFRIMAPALRALRKRRSK